MLLSLLHDCQGVVWEHHWLLPLVLVQSWDKVVLAEDNESWSGARETIESYFWIKETMHRQTILLCVENVEVEYD